jgi:hypothetical protein
VTLPGADELFRTTGGAALQAPQPRQQPQQHAGGEPQGDTRLRPVQDGEPAEGDADTTDEGQNHGAAQRGGGPEGGGPADHGGRDTPQNRRPPVGSGSTVNGTAPAPPQALLPAQPPHLPAVPAQHPVPPQAAAQPQPQPAARRKAPRQNRRPSGRERHDEKITVYVSAEELMDLEHARLVLRGEHGLAIDRGRIVREAVAVVLADLESRGDASILVRRLRGR